MSNDFDEENFGGISDEDFIDADEVEAYYESEEGIAEEFRKVDSPQASDYDSPEEPEDVFDAPVEVNYEREGFSGDVSPSVFVSKSFPHIEIIDITSITNIKLKILQRMLKGFQVVGNEYPVYVTLDGSLQEIGKVQDYQVQALINTVGEDCLVGRLSETKELQGYMLYALSN